MLNSGDKLAHFSIIKPLGEGGMGEVYLAEDTNLHRQVAIKTLRDDYFDNPDRRDRFEREARTAAQISHSNVMSIYDTGVATAPDSGKEVHYIVMELIEGKPLDEWVKGHESDMVKMLRVAEAIGSGIAAAHKLNIVHRDIKSDNIIVTEDDQPKILDFGLAKPIDPLQATDKPISGETVKQELTKVGTVIGTVSYMSPEQARGETVDGRSDIFSFGVLLYKMFTGQMPFSGSSQVSILAKILESPHPRVHNIKADIDPEIERIIDKCLQKDANDRYQDIRDLVVDLRNLRRRYDSGISTTVSQVAHGATLAGQPATRNATGTLWKVGVGLAVVVLLALAYFLFSGGGSKSTTAMAQEYTLAILSFDNRTGDPKLDWLESGLPEILLTDLAQGQDIRLISQRRILETLGGEGNELSEYSYDQQFQAAKKLGAVHVISGSIFKQGDKFRIATQLEEVSSGDVLFGENVVGSDPFSLVDSLTKKVASSLKLSNKQFTDHSVTQLTTTNTDAYRYYHLGLNEFLNANYGAARKLFQRAIIEDTTFAMPYLRMGMAYVFDGKTQEALPFIAKAKKFEDHLPTRDRGLLDVYSELWLTNNLDSAFTKLESLVKSFPTDPEVLAIYAILQWQLKQNSAAAIDALEKADKVDPTFQLAQIFAYQIYAAMGNDAKALEIARSLRKNHPDSPLGYRYEAHQFVRSGEIDQAEQTLQLLVEKFPLDESGYNQLTGLYLRARDFDKAAQIVEKYGKRFSDDPYKMMTYWDNKANLANWEGHFLDNMKDRFNSLKFAKQTGDSNLISDDYSAIGQYYNRFDENDSAVYYFDKALDYVQNFGARASIPVSLVSADRSLAGKIRPMFEEAVESFKERVPANLSYVASALEDMFNGLAKADTALYIKGNRSILKLTEANTTTASSNQRELGITLVDYRKYQEGIKMLTPVVEGNTATSSGYHYPMTNYYLGVAYDELGQKEKAKEHLQEMLKYWGKPQIELKQIKDARKRLAQLRG